MDRLRPGRRALIRTWSLVLVCFLVVSCGPATYPMKIDRNHSILLVRDVRQTPVRLIVDTGAPYSFLNKRWAVSVGAEVIPCADSQAPGINASVFWNSTGRGIPVPQGVPPVLEGLPLVEPDPGSLLAMMADAGEPAAGILGLDVLEGWSLDYREEPLLVAGPVDGGRSPDRPRYDLYQNGVHWWVPCSLSSVGGGDNFATLALVDTGSVLAAAWYHPKEDPWVGEVTNPRALWQLNGLATAWFSTPNLQIGDFAPAPLVVTSVTWPDPTHELSIGTPFLVRHRAVLNLADHTLTYERKARERQEFGLGAEAWAWAASVEPGAGIRVAAVVAGSVLDRRGVRSGSLIRTVGGEPAGRPRSVLEWNRAWMALALGQFTP